MAVLETIRVKFGLAVSIIIALGLLSFIISPNDIAALKGAGNQQKVGTINGHEVTAEAFESQKNALSSLDSKYNGLVQQMFNAQGAYEQQEVLSQVAWSHFMSEYLYNEYCENAGFSVVDGEVVAAVKASFPAELRNLTSDDSQLKTFMKDQVRAQLFMSKYTSVFAGLANKTVVEIADEKDAANKSVNVDVVKVAYPEYAEVEVSDADLEAYYNTHKAQYKNFISTRDVEYAYFRVLPSAQDVELAVKGINLEEDFDLIESVWVKSGDLAGLPYAIESFVNDHNVGTSELVQVEDKFFAVKVYEAAKRAEEGSNSAPVNMKRIALLVKDIYVSNNTVDSYQKLADRFASVAGGTYEGFVAALDSVSAETAESTIVAESRNLGVINGTEKVTAWAFEASEGSCSKTFQVNYDYFLVAVVKAVHDKGYKSLSEVKDEVREAVYQQKIAEASVAEVSEKAKDAANLAAVAKATGSAKRTISGLRFSSNENDPVLTGAVAAAVATGKTGLVGPVKGKDGVYYFEVKSDVKEEDLYNEADAYRSMMTDLQGIAYGGQLLRAGYMQYLQPEIEFHSNIKDERLSLYR